MDDWRRARVHTLAWTLESFDTTDPPERSPAHAGGILMKNSCTHALIGVTVVSFGAIAFTQGWPQWGQNPQHSGATSATGQNPAEILASAVYDPFVAQEQAENNGELLAHYQAPLTDGEDVFMEFISGTYVSCNPTG